MKFQKEIQYALNQKRKFTFYSFKMESKLLQGEWFAEIKSLENGKTLLIATESIEYKNPVIRMIGYTFMNLNAYMKTYQTELKNKLEKTTNNNYQ